MQVSASGNRILRWAFIGGGKAKMAKPGTHPDVDLVSGAKEQDIPSRGLDSHTEGRVVARVIFGIVLRTIRLRGTEM